MSRYAEHTTVSVEKTQAEVVQLLKRYKASAHGFMHEGQKVTVGFQLDEVKIRFMLFVPPPSDPQFNKKDRYGMTIKDPGRRAELAAQEERRLWRSLLLVIKAKLEAVDAGVETIEEAFMAQVVLPGGTTMAEFHRNVLKPAIAGGTFARLAGIADKPSEPAA